MVPSTRMRRPAASVSRRSSCSSRSMPSAGWGSKLSLSRCRSERNCNRIRRMLLAQPLLDARLHLRQVRRQVIRQLREQLVVQLELLDPGRAVDADHAGELLARERQAVPAQVLIARADAEGVVVALAAA